MTTLGLRCANELIGRAVLSPKVRRLSLRIPDNLYEEIEQLALANGVTVTALITATLRQQAALFEKYGQTPASEWHDHPMHDRWVALVADARGIDRERRSRRPKDE